MSNATSIEKAIARRRAISSSRVKPKKEAVAS